MMLLWIRWNHISVPDSRISSVSVRNCKTVSAHSARGQIYSALQLHETNSSNYLARHQTYGTSASRAQLWGEKPQLRFSP